MMYLIDVRRSFSVNGPRYVILDPASTRIRELRSRD